MASGSIYQLLQSPEDQRAKRLQVRSLLDEQTMRGLQRQQFEQGVADEQEVRRLSSEAGGDLGRLSDLLGARGLYKPAQAIRTQIQAGQKTAAEISNAEAQAAQRRAETLIKNIGISRDELARVNDDEGYQRWARIAGALLPEQMMQGLPQAFDPAWRDKTILTADEVLARSRPSIREVNDGKTVRFVESNPTLNPAITSTTIAMQTTPGQDQVDVRARETAEMTDARTRAEGAANRGVTMRGQNMTDARSREANAGAQLQYDGERGMLVDRRTGQTRPLIGQDGQPLPVTGKPPTEGQAKAILFGSRMENADRLLTQLADRGADMPSMAVRAADAVPLVGGALRMAANTAFASPAQQQVEQAQRDFVNAVLRRESGAVISDTEFANAAQQYFPQPGDTDAVRSQKSAARRAAISGIRAEAGAPFQPQIDAIVRQTGITLPPVEQSGRTRTIPGSGRNPAPSATGGWSVEPVR